MIAQATPLPVDHLITRLKRGDREALTEIQRHLYRRMLRAALQSTHSQTLAEDAVAITLTKLWVKRHLLPETWEEASRYILRMVQTAATDVTRPKEERVTRCPLDEARYLPEAQLEESGFDETIETALSTVESMLLPQLSARHLRVLTPVAEALSQEAGEMRNIYAEIAAQQEMQPGSVRNSWSDAGKKLQTVLQELGWQDFGEDDVRSILCRIGKRLAPSA